VVQILRDWPLWGYKMGTTPTFAGTPVPGVGPAGGGNTDVQKLMAAIAQLLQQNSALAQSGGGQGGPSGGLVTPPRTPQLTPSTAGAPGAPLSYAPPPGYVPIPSSATGAGMQASRDFGSPKAAKSAGIAAIGQTISGVLQTVEQREQQKKATMAENYMMQISALIQSGDPSDRQKAMIFLEDPKIRKTLKTGLEYVPLEEPVPPEAMGIKSAIDKLNKGQVVNAVAGTPTAPGQKPPKPQMQPVLPQSGQANNLQAMITNALMQRGKQDPNSLISMAGGSQLTSQEQRMAEFYEKGLGMAPAQVAGMSMQAKLEGLKMYEQMMRDQVQAQLDMQKTAMTTGATIAGKKIEAQSRVNVADILAGSRKAVAGIVAQTKDQKGAAANYAAGSKMYESLAATYAKLAETPGISADQKKQYQSMADGFSKKADDFLNQQMDEQLIQALMGPGGDNQ
jgi:hypothetical protein